MKVRARSSSFFKRFAAGRSVARRLALITSLSTFAVLLVAGSASAASPWWHLTSGSRPTNLHAGGGSNEIWQLTINATGGEYAVFCGLSCFNAGHSSIAFPVFNAPATGSGSLQESLESLYGAGNIEVAGREEKVPGEEFVYTIVFGGELAARPVALPQVKNALFGKELTGGRKEANLVETAKGQPDGEIILTAVNVGDAPVAGATTPVTLADTLPPGLQAVSVTGGLTAMHSGVATLDKGPVSCTLATLVCTFAGTMPPYAELEVRIGVSVGAATAAESNRFAISGGGALPASLSRPLRVGASTPFGVEEYEMQPEEPGGALATQAGSHPFQLTTQVTLNQTPATEGDHYDVHPAALAKDVGGRLPAGLIGNPTPFPTCSLADFLATPAGTAVATECPPSTVLGVSVTAFDEPSLTGLVTNPEPIYNLEPAAGEPARFGFKLPATPVVIDSSVRSDGDYGLTATSHNISQTAGLVSSQLVFWGVPGDPRHDNARGLACLQEPRGEVPTEESCRPLEQAKPPAFLTMPTSCSGGPLLTSIDADSWPDPGDVLNFPSTSPMPTLDGCNRLPFSPTIAAEPTTDAATSPTGLNFDINVADEGLTNAEGLAQSQIKRTVVTLPQGFTTNPSVAEGLHACPQAAYENSTVDGSVGCPENSKVGEVEIESPLVKQTIHGGLFVAKQGENPNADNLLTIYLVAKNPELGVIVKQALKVTPDPLTGQLTTEVDNIPQLPFSRFHLSFRQGQRSPLISPPTCGNYTVKADLYPYSNPNVPLTKESSFAITTGPEGNSCPAGTPPFHPNLEAGTLNNAAGTYSPFVTKITRRDSEQEITHFSIKLPPGVSGKLAGIPECSDAGVAAAKAREHEGGGTEEEQSPSCPAASEVGHSLVGSGVGNVLAYAPGKLYLAGPYHGSNISLVSITAAKVGPFDLGTVVVRFALKIDPETAEVSVDGATSDPIPHIVDGIPVHLRDIRAYVDRPEFVFNPTSCKKTSTASTVLGSGLNFASEADDVPVTVTSPFQAADCAALAFKPSLALSLKGGTKRGATPAFKAVLTFPKGSNANIAESQVTLPHSEFLEQSHIGTVCTRAQFKEGTTPGEKCPAASVYGKAEAITPILSEPLKGPVYLRSSSHNLPDLVAALHNKQVDIALDGRIDSVENGRIRNTFEAVPDAPVSKFVLEMQGGKKGLLVNSTDICRTKHKAISHFVGQNGKVYDTNPVLSAKCGKKAKKKGNKKHRRQR
jgi:hypothetical protein